MSDFGAAVCLTETVIASSLSLVSSVLLVLVVVSENAVTTDVSINAAAMIIFFMYRFLKNVVSVTFN
jgi:hypothetical protein